MLLGPRSWVRIFGSFVPGRSVPRFWILVPGPSFLGVLFLDPRFWVLVPQSLVLVRSAVTRPTPACIGTVIGCKARCLRVF